MRVILGNSNTKWGVIIRPQSSNVYRHILSFDTPELKDDFINKYIMKNQNYKTELKNSKNRGVMEIDALNITFRVNPDEYPFETFETLLNKDFCITQDEHEKIKFYAITDAKRVGNIIEYQAQIDIFFTYDIKDIFQKDTYTQINRAMLDRFYKDGTDIKMITEKNHNLDDDFFINEELQVPEESLIPNDEPDKVLVDYTPFISTTGLTDAEIADINKAMGEIKWAIVYAQTKGAKTNFNLEWEDIEYEFTSGGAYLPYFTIIVPTNLEFGERAMTTSTGLKIKNHFPNAPVGTTLGRLEEILEKAQILKSSYTILPYSPFNQELHIDETGNVNKESFTISYDKVNKTISLNWLYVNEDHSSVQEKFITKDVMMSYWTSADRHHVFFYKKSMDMDIVRENVKSKIKPIPNILDTTPTINDVVINKHTRELKSYFAPFRHIELKSTTTFKQKLLPQYFNKNEIVMKSDYSYMTENWGYWLMIKDYYIFNIYKANNKHYVHNNENILFTDTSNYSLPTDINAWEEFMSNNKAQQNAQFVNRGVGLALGLGGLALGGMTGGASLALGMGAISVAGKSAMDLNNQLAMRKDIQNAPNKIVANGSTLIQDVAIKDLAPHLTEYVLPKIEDVKIKEHFYKFGYNLNGKIEDISKLLNTRYYFNYIESPETFENIAMQISASTKQIINDSVASGLTIWHVRDLTTFKGVKSYTHENLEMSII